MDVDGSSSQNIASSAGSSSIGHNGFESATSSATRQDGTEPSGSGGGPTGRKRKVPDSVTPNACTNCKKARAKVYGPCPHCHVRNAKP